MVDLERIRQKTQIIQEALRKLDNIKEYNLEEFLQTPFVADACLYNLQISIEALLDIGSHIVARQNLGLPKTYADIIRLLVQAGIMPAEKEAIYVNMVEFRNRIVHMYDDVSLEEVYYILQNHLDDVREFIALVIREYLEY